MYVLFLLLYSPFCSRKNITTRTDRSLSFLHLNLLRHQTNAQQFRDKHLSILAQNAYALAKRVHKLEAANATQSQENRAQEAENGKLRTELAALRAQNARLNQTSHPTHLAATLQPSRPSHRPSSSVLGGSSTHVDATRTNDSLRNPIRQRQSHGDPPTMPDSTLESTQYGVQQASPSRFTNILHGVRTRDQPGSIAKLPRRHLEIERGNTRQAVASSLNAAAVRQSKRRREGRPTPPALTLKRSRRIPPPALVPKRASRAQPSVVAASRAQRSAPRFTSSKPTATAELSRFARGAGSNSIRGNLLRGTSTQQPGDWQRRVSSVPRPSATPDRLGKNAQRRNRHGSNPLARW
ncbi:unnamed protein product [Chondrus crispus]|uniref:Uncharacterized protein n=1 Tax=Chondrus crispus TaxID=2769 RepID=R7QRE8_CHOCR|nr:unnamed protein product [Chondrus crispus]CDF41057.1 unnamed protein product [Chondrus crispus]|eukprot:XP_005711351.1 unnamed protein product [Chondrus crispus]